MQRRLGIAVVRGSKGCRFENPFGLRCSCRVFVRALITGPFWTKTAWPTWKPPKPWSRKDFDTECRRYRHASVTFTSPQGNQSPSICFSPSGRLGQRTSHSGNISGSFSFRFLWKHRQHWPDSDDFFHVTPTRSCANSGLLCRPIPDSAVFAQHPHGPHKDASFHPKYLPSCRGGRPVFFRQRLHPRLPGLQEHLSGHDMVC